MQSKYEQLRAVINNLFPERLELRFGSTVHFEDGFIGSYIGESIAGNWLVYHRGSSRVWTKKPPKMVKILGQPLMPHEILRAIDKKNRGNFYLRTDGTLFVWKKFASSKNGHNEIEPKQIEIELSKQVSSWSDGVIENIIKLIE